MKLQDMIQREIQISHNGVWMYFVVTKRNQLKLLHFSVNPLNEKELQISVPPSDWGDGDKLKEGWPLVQLQIPGFDRPYEKQGNKYLVTSPGYRLTFVSFEDSCNEIGRLLTFIQRDEETSLLVTSTMQFYGDLPVLRCRNTVTNCGNEVLPLEYLSSFFYQGIEKEGAMDPDEKLYLMIPHNSWMKEMNWKTYSLPDLGMQSSQPDTQARRSSKSFVVSNVGHWSTKEFLPMGYLGNKESDTGLFWQIEHNGSWNYEISDYNGHLCLGISGPEELRAHWVKNLVPGESFTSVPVAAGMVHDSFEEAMAALTRYRRMIRRPNQDNEELPVIFNDYMNCLFGDPTVENELPLIDAAAEAGCEYYVIDAGWYADGFWWDSVGEWKESSRRFPQGIRFLMDYIRSKGMIPGLWLELEVMGIHCDLAKKVPEEWFFKRHGRKIYDRSRYQLDFRHPDVIAHVSEVIRRLVEDYGCGYIKMDYNIEPGIGTETDADSFGDGLMAHEKAYLNWLDGIFAKYPDLVIENCSSGGLRMDYAMLSRYSIQSTSDNEDYRMYATISANAPAAVTPEQAAIWSYPRRTGDPEETIFNMVNALLGRIHQSGHLAELSEENLSYVKEGIAFYKSIRKKLKTAVPHWPIGLSDYRDSWSALALECQDGSCYLAIWRRYGEEEKKTLALPYGKGKEIRCAYPYGECDFEWDAEQGNLTVIFPKEVMARVFEMNYCCEK